MIVLLFEALSCLLFIFVLYITIRLALEQARCDHDGGVNETQACDAICKLCGKNLGFIGTEENKKRRSQ